MSDGRTTGLKRIRLVASIVGAFMFGMTGAEQFRAEGGAFVLPGVLISALLGFGLLWIVMTIIIFLVRTFTKGK